MGDELQKKVSQTMKGWALLRIGTNSKVDEEQTISNKRMALLIAL